MKNIKFEPNKVYHLYNHAVGTENIFRSEANYFYFLKKFGEYSAMVFSTYAYCLMPNHFHFMVRVKDIEEVYNYYVLKSEDNNDVVSLKIQTIEEFDFHKFVMKQLKNFCNGYAQAYNKMYERKGALFIDYVKRKEITHPKYFSRLVHYIHFNPVHHGFCRNIEDWIYSSYHAHVSYKNTLLSREEVLEWFGDRMKFRQFHKSIPEKSLFLDYEY